MFTHKTITRRDILFENLTYLFLVLIAALIVRFALTASGAGLRADDIMIHLIQPGFVLSLCLVSCIAVLKGRSWKTYVLRAVMVWLTLGLVVTLAECGSSGEFVVAMFTVCFYLVVLRWWWPVLKPSRPNFPK